LTYVDGQVTFALSPLIRGISLARKILLADDSVTAQNMGRKILADAGYEVIAVNNGSAALKKIAELKPDLVILDVYMPGYSGLEVCQRLKESQETARIPVLLTVGKLEPFKPEEAQRVRAEGYIVKPFEASELLSALSKLEDKVVPRAEPSKPGRFARAIAAAEESSRGNWNEKAGDQNGWKSRIGFPHEKTEPEEKVAEEASTYNPINRDLRTVVETAGEKAAEKSARNEKKRHQAGEAAETSVDVAALAPAGLPKDVTPEELAAITAAAAQIQMAGAAIKDEHRVTGAAITEKIAETTSQPSPEAAADRMEEKVPPALDTQGASTPVSADAKPEALRDGKDESKIDSPAFEGAAPHKHHRRSGDKKPEETEDVPVTMAATAESVVAASVGVSRWTAVPVALEGEEATVSLDQEMQKAYAAFVAEEADSAAVASVPESQAAPAGNFSVRAETAAEAPVAAISSPEPEPVPESEPVMGAAATESEPMSVAQPEGAAATSSFVPADFANPDFATPDFAAKEQASLPEPVFPAPVIAKVSPAASNAETFSMPEFAESNQEPMPHPVSPVAEPDISHSAGFAAEPAAEPRPDSEAVKSTAAAWASWRQVRDTGNGGEVVQAQPKEFRVPESTPVETARAVAAGAEQILQEASVGAPSGNPADVASIVDSVLADLRPKLMAEISRKMAEKK
jgi:CheY-like chemotaxis protein